jgi:hypothetical protein
MDLDDDNPFPEPVEIEITDIFDLHTIPPRDVKRVVEEYLQLARDKGFRSVRIIHGKGVGVQRQMVRSILARTSFVVDWTDAPPDAGGLGATIVRFAPETKSPCRAPVVSASRDLVFVTQLNEHSRQLLVQRRGTASSPLLAASTFAKLRSDQPFPHSTRR